MRVDHDPGTGRVLLDTEGFDTLVAAAGGEAIPEGSVTDLIESGAAGAALSAVRAPLVRLRLGVAGPRGLRSHDGWVTREVAALRLAVTADECQLLAVEPQFLAAGLARVVHLAPRKVGERAARSVDADVVEDLFHEDGERRGSAFGEAGCSFAWSLSVRWRGGAVTTTVVDGAEGTFLVTYADAVLLQPISPTRLWRRLTTALPPDDNLDAG